jgi:hypothetical protein
MRLVPVVCVLCVLAASWPLAAMAGSPDNPGGTGHHVVSDKEASQVSHPDGFGQSVAESAQDGDSLGEHLELYRDLDGATPNPANDNGGGND